MRAVFRAVVATAIFTLGSIGRVAAQSRQNAPSYLPDGSLANHTTNVMIQFIANFILSLIVLCALGGIFYWLYPLYEPIARWYFFYFHPHPAESMVRAGIAAGAPPLDGKALAASLGELPPGSRILRQVRLEQGERLVSLMQHASRARARELEKSARHGLEQAALASIQEAIALAAIALERAKATFAASQMIRS